MCLSCTPVGGTFIKKLRIPQKGKTYMLSFDNEIIHRNILRIAYGRGYDEKAISDYLDLDSEEDITLFDIVKASIMLKVRPSVFLYEVKPLEMEDEEDTVSEADIRKAKLLESDEEKLRFLTVVLPYSLRKNLLSLIMSVRIEGKLYCRLYQPVENLLVDTYDELSRIWKEYGKEYKKQRDGIVYDSLDMHPIRGISDDDRGIIRGLNATVKDYVELGNLLGYDSVRILDGNTTTMPEDEYFSGVYSTLSSELKEIVWSLALMTIEDKYKAGSVQPKANHSYSYSYI